MPAFLGRSTTSKSIRFRLYLYTAEIGQPITIRATYAGGSYIVRGWDRRIVSIAETPVVDHEAPLNEPVTISVQVGDQPSSEWVSVTDTIPSDYPLISDPLLGNHMEVTIQSWPDWAYERAGKTVEISDSRFPVIIDGFERGATSTLTLIHNRDTESARILQQVLRDKSVLRVRPSCPGLPAAWVSVRGRSRRRFSARTDSAQVDVLDLIHTDMPDRGQEAIGSSLQALHDAVPTTLAAISARWPNAGLITISLADLS